MKSLFKQKTIEEPMSRVELEQLIYSAIKHQPKYYGLILGEDGWIGIDTLIYRINFLENKEVLSRSKLLKLAENNPKFTLNFFKTQIKANEINDDSLVMIRKSIPPILLYLVLNKNCTREDDSIVPCNGKDRVKLRESVDREIDANRVLKINSEQMFAAGYSFYRSDKNDWFTKCIPIQFASKFDR